MDVLIIKGRYKHIPVQVHIGSERLCGQKVQPEGEHLCHLLTKATVHRLQKHLKNTFIVTSVY